MIIMIIVGGILVLGLLKFLSQLFNGTGPVSKGLGNIFGAGAHFINGVSNGCMAQSDCKKEGSEDDCVGGNGCSWNFPTQSDKEGSCLNTTGKPVGSGSFFSSGCIAGMGFLSYIGGSMFLGVFGLFINWGKNKLSNTKAQLEDKPINEVVKEQLSESSKAVEKILEERSESGKPELKESEITDLASKVGNNVATSDAIKAVNGQSGVSKEEIARQLNEIKTQNENEQKDIEEVSTENGVSKESQSENTDEANSAVPIE
jgi:hypothetical protein